ncbi:sensor domain-containing diguanylate cyclase [Pseudomonas sp. zfem002]|uniref:sensor domain-containing diguanylate cyclase n=1 Tax=Pseudomonas sp. zfem002 TaxID=3078197 RepID=UPI002928418D|nr:sensor domain-containing diguanylate cyclase [Pseudomonas sp. zfem002]MDU9392244.1 sensor domain-containing diguanylate cyclase [Pseudomonas sp. zfem002]
MPNRPRPKLNLRFLLLALVFSSSVATLINTFWVMFSTQKREMIESALETNRTYAMRVATSIEGVLDSDLDRLKYSAGRIGATLPGHQALTQEAQRLFEQDDSFNSVLVTNANGIIIASAPQSLNLDGKEVLNREPLDLRKPMVSDAFESLSKNLVVFISHPIFASDGRYLGLVGGSIRLEQKSTLQALMDLNVRQDGAFVYLTDSKRRVLYHPDARQIGKSLAQGSIVDSALSRTSGSMNYVDERGNEMLGGYAGIPTSRWVVVSQQPLTSIEDTLNDATLRVAKGVLPLALFGFLLIWWLGTKISTPLSRLAEGAKRLDMPESYDRIRAVPADYYESWQIRRALLLAATLLAEKIGRLNKEAQSDALTGLANRRAMQERLSFWQEMKTPFAVVSIDIDHFKRVNDTFGHAAGDETLRFVATLMKQNSRPDDLLCRVGGEEFVLLLSGGSMAVAKEVAERLRISIENTSIETVGHVTVSLGVALWNPGQDIPAVLKKADQMLYMAKQLGRNRVILEDPSISLEEKA